MTKVGALFSGLAVAALATPSGAAEYLISQKGKKYAPDEIHAKVGDVLIFDNNDKVGHNVYSESPGLEFSTGKQKPGEQDRISLETPGEFEIRCAIHPRMKLSVVVTE